MPTSAAVGIWRTWDEGPPVPYVEKELLARIRQGLILDLGCGSGKGLIRFQNYGWSTVGLDLTVSVPRGIRGEGVVKGSGSFLPFWNESFDAILMAQVLHHLEQPQQAFLEVRRVLKKEGYLLMGENIENNLFLRVGRDLLPCYDGVRVYNRLSKEDVRGMLQNSGFRILAEASGVFLWLPWYELTRLDFLSPLRPFSFVIKKIDAKLERVFRNSHAQYYCLCAKSSSAST